MYDMLEKQFETLFVQHSKIFNTAYTHRKKDARICLDLILDYYNYLDADEDALTWDQKTKLVAQLKQDLNGICEEWIDPQPNTPDN